MMTLSNLMGGSIYKNFGTDLQMGAGWPRAVVLHPTTSGLHVSLPNSYFFKTPQPCRFYLVNVGSSSLSLKDGYDFIIQTGGVASSTSTVTVLTGSGLSTSDNYYNDNLLSLTGGTGSGQSQIITGFVGLTGAATVGSAWSPVPDATTTYSITRLSSSFSTLSAGYVATISLFQLSNNALVWNGTQRATGSGRAFAYARADGSSRVSVYNPPTIPLPVIPPPPFVSTQADLSSCASSFTATIADGIDEFLVWNGAWTLTKSSASPYYWRCVVDSNHYIDLRVYPPNLPQFYPQQYQVVLVDLTGKARMRYGANGAGPCPIIDIYTPFDVPSEGAIRNGHEPDVTIGY